MKAHSLRDLRWTLRSVVNEVVATGEEAIITDDGNDVAVIITMSEYEGLRADRFRRYEYVDQELPREPRHE